MLKFSKNNIENREGWGELFNLRDVGFYAMFSKKECFPGQVSQLFCDWLWHSYKTSNCQYWLKFFLQTLKEPNYAKQILDKSGEINRNKARKKLI